MDAVTVVVEHPRLGPSRASALGAQFDRNLVQFDVGEETEAPEVPRLQCVPQRSVTTSHTQGPQRKSRPVAVHFSRVGSEAPNIFN